MQWCSVRARSSSVAPGCVIKTVVTPSSPAGGRSDPDWESAGLSRPGPLVLDIRFDKDDMPRKRINNKKVTLPVLNPDAAGIDIGATEIYVAVPADRDPEPVRMFATFTQDLNQLADWLQRCGVRTVAMESTGVYWIPLMQLLETRGLEGYLVNAKHVKNVPGRRTDVSDCQWLQYLHSVGLLRPSFRPEQNVCAVRSLLRHRDSLIEMATCHVHHMQKALDQMNLQIHHVISDITGTTGLAIIDAILEGKRDVYELAALRDPRVRASHETIAKSLVGDYRQEHLFTLRQSVALYREYQKRITACEDEMQTLMKELDSKGDGDANLPAAKDSVKKCKVMHPARAMALRQEAYRILGVDLTTIPGISVLHVQTIVAELGGDISKFRSAGAFSSWMGLCPDNDISGGKVLWSGTRKVKNRIAITLRMAAQSLQRSESALGEFYRRMRAKLGPPKAITAAAHKLARVVFHLLKSREAYDDSVFAKAEERYRLRTENRLRAQAQALGYTLVPGQTLESPRLS
jgi:transposase